MYHVEAVYSMSYNINGIREHAYIYDSGNTKHCYPIIVILVLVVYGVFDLLNTTLCVTSLLDICWFGKNSNVVHIIMSSDTKYPNYQ